MADENKIYLAVISFIKDGLREGSLKTGDRLPTERELASALNVSRNSIREALRTLHNMGILECIQGSGNYLRGNLGRGLSEALSIHLLMDEVRCSEVIQLQRSLEVESFIGILEKDVSCDLTQMQQLAEQMESDSGQNAEAEYEFHRNLIRWNSNILFNCLSEAILDACREVVQLRLKEMDRQKIRDCHYEILHALQERNKKSGIAAITRLYQIMENAACKS
jgi:GntR family transcriptional repressor for pyruvate dehydrogenase complex